MEGVVDKGLALGGRRLPQGGEIEPETFAAAELALPLQLQLQGVTHDLGDSPARELAEDSIPSFCLVWVTGDLDACRGGAMAWPVAAGGSQL